MPSDRPRKIYRFQRFTARTFESLCHDQLHFADPIAFNDPLDCQPTVESDSDRGELRLILTELIRRRIRGGSFCLPKKCQTYRPKSRGKC